VGSAGNTESGVLLAQFVLAASDHDVRAFGLTIGYGSGIQGSSVQYASWTFVIPAPDAGLRSIAACLAWAGRRRR